MSLDKYRQWKHKFDNTVPIRGRAIQVKPWGERRRDWEQITKVLTPYGEGYGAMLYDTNCVIVNPDGSMDISTGSWATPITAEWIHYRSGLRCYKRYNKLWLDVDGRTIPLGDKPTHLTYNQESGKYECDKTFTMTQQVVDKDKIKAVRHSIKELKTFVKVMMKLSDGWIGEEIKNIHKTKNDNMTGYWANYQYNLLGKSFNSYEIRSDRMSERVAQGLLECMQQVELDEDKVKLMLILTEGMGYEESRIVRVEDYEREYNGTKHRYQNEVREYRYNPDSVVRRIDYIIKKGADVFTTKEVEVNKPMTSLQ